MRYQEAHSLTERRVSDLLPHDRELLKSLLKETYRARSKFVHEGDRVEFLKGIRFEGTPLTPGLPLPFAVLRSILRELIQIEVTERANPGNLPDVVLWYSKRDLG